MFGLYAVCLNIYPFSIVFRIRFRRHVYDCQNPWKDTRTVESSSKWSLVSCSFPYQSMWHLKRRLSILGESHVIDLMKRFWKLSNSINNFGKQRIWMRNRKQNKNNRLKLPSWDLARPTSADTASIKTFPLHWLKKTVWIRAKGILAPSISAFCCDVSI